MELLNFGGATQLVGCRSEFALCLYGIQGRKKSRCKENDCDYKRTLHVVNNAC